MVEWHFYHPTLDGIHGVGNGDMYGLYDTDTQICYVFGKNLSENEIVNALSHEMLHHVVFKLGLLMAECLTVAYDKISDKVESE